MSSESTRIVDGYRRDDRRRLLFAVAPAFTVALVGAVLACLGARSLVTRDPSRGYAGRPTAGIVLNPAPVEPAPPWETLFLYAGAALCVLSPVILGVSLHRLVDDRDFLLLRHDGLVHQAGGRALLYRWDELDAVRHDSEHEALVLIVRDEGEVRIDDRYVGTTPEELAVRVADVRRKALFQMLPSQRRD